MIKIDGDWFSRNWKWVLLSIMFLIVVPMTLYHLLTMDADLWDESRRKKMTADLISEMKSIELPPKTAINRFEGHNEFGKVFIESRYRTELGSVEFFNYFDHVLQQKGWLRYDQRSDDLKTYRYCRGHQDAFLALDSGEPIWSNDPGQYWTLGFDMGLRPMIGSGGRPSECVD